MINWVLFNHKTLIVTYMASPKKQAKVVILLIIVCVIILAVYIKPSGISFHAPEFLNKDEIIFTYTRPNEFSGLATYNLATNQLKILKI